MLLYVIVCWGRRALSCFGPNGVYSSRGYTTQINFNVKWKKSTDYFCKLTKFSSSVVLISSSVQVGVEIRWKGEEGVENGNDWMIHCYGTNREERGLRLKRGGDVVSRYSEQHDQKPRCCSESKTSENSCRFNIFHPEKWTKWCQNECEASTSFITLTCNIITSFKRLHTFLLLSFLQVFSGFLTKSHL